MKYSNLVKIVVISLGVGAAGIAQAGWEEGVAALKSKNYTEAARHFQEVTKEHPEWPNGYFMLGQSLLKVNKTQDALSAFREAYNLNPNDVNYQYSLASTYAKAKRYREAAELLGKIDPGKLPEAQRPGYHKTYAATLSKSGQGDKALQALGASAKASPSDAAAQYNYGAALFNAGQVERSLAPLSKAVQLDGNDPNKLKAYVDALQRRGREVRGSGKASYYTKAVTTARQLVAKKPSYDNYLLLGEAQLGTGSYTDAIASFEQAAQRNGSEWIPHFYTGQAHTANKNYPEAERALRKALDNQPSSKDQTRVWKQLGFVFEKQKKFTEAVSAYNSAGDSAGATRVSENQEIAKHNQAADAEAKAYEEILAEEKKLQEQLKALGDSPPRR